MAEHRSTAMAEREDPAIERERLKVLVDRLAESEVHAALRYLEFLSEGDEDPVERALRDAAIDDEPLSPEELADHNEARRDVAAGHVYAHDQIRKELVG